MCSLTVTFALGAAAGPGTITVAASRNVTVAPDQLMYGIIVRTPLGGSVSDAVALAPGIGITAANLTDVSEDNGMGDIATVAWTFQMTAPFSRLKDLNATLSGLEQNAGTRNGRPALIYSVSSQTSADAVAQVCDPTALVNDARQAAGLLAAGAGGTLGGVVGMSEGSGGSGAGVFLSGQGLLSASFILNVSTAPGCQMTVQFQLVR